MEGRLCVGRVWGGVDGGDGEFGVDDDGSGKVVVVTVGECGVGGSATG